MKKKRWKTEKKYQTWWFAELKTWYLLPKINIERNVNFKIIIMLLNPSLYNARFVLLLRIYRYFIDGLCKNIGKNHKLK